MRAAASRVRTRLGWAVVGAGLMSAALIWPVVAESTLLFVVDSFVDVAPTIAVGLLLAAWVTASGAATITATWFEGRRGSAIVIASALGSVSPVCGVTVLPLMTGFLAAGVPLAPVMAFWLSSPVTDPAMFAVTWAVLGPAFAIGKTASAFLLGALAGFSTNALNGTNVVRHPLRSAGRWGGDMCGTDGAAGFNLRIWQEPRRMRVFRAELLATGRLVSLCLTFAFAAEFLLRDLMPPHVMASYVGEDSALAIPLAVIVGAPIYLDGYAALPLIRGLLDLGMSPGAALAFLVSGGAVSVWGLMAVVAVLRPMVLTLFVAIAVAGSLCAGYAFQLVWEVL